MSPVAECITVFYPRKATVVWTWNSRVEAKGDYEVQEHGWLTHVTTTIESISSLNHSATWCIAMSMATDSLGGLIGGSAA